MLSLTYSQNLPLNHGAAIVVPLLHPWHTTGTTLIYLHLMAYSKGRGTDVEIVVGIVMV